MEVKRPQTTREITKICNIKTGETFIYKDCIYLKVEDFNRITFINLETNRVENFDTYCPVTLCKAHIVIES